MPFTVYIDESGEAGITKVRKGAEPGASPYFVLGAAVMQPATQVFARKLVEDFRGAISKKNWKHATELDHTAKVFLAREISKLHARFFAVVSNKETLGEYREMIDGNPQKFYNKCLKYLLERVCMYLGRFSVAEGELSVVLENRNHDFDAMLRYLDKVRSKPIYPESKSLKILNPFSIVTRKKGEDLALEIADFVAHAVYQCTNKSGANFNIPEYRYFKEISARFAGDGEGKVLGVGLKCIHSLEMLNLDEDIELLFRSTRVAPPLRP